MLRTCTVVFVAEPPTVGLIDVRRALDPGTVMYEGGRLLDDGARDVAAAPPTDGAGVAAAEKGQARLTRKVRDVPGVTRPPTTGSKILRWLAPSLVPCIQCYWCFQHMKNEDVPQRTSSP